jgi:hypothetical protein
LPIRCTKKIKIQFDWAEFVSVSQNPDINKILEGIHSSAGPDCEKTFPDQQKLIGCIRHHLEHKRCAYQLPWFLSFVLVHK